MRLSHVCLHRFHADLARIPGEQREDNLLPGRQVGTLRLIKDTANAGMWIRLHITIETGIILTRLLDQLGHWMHIVLFAQIEPILERDFIPTIEDILSICPHNACFQECRLFPERVEVVIRGQNQKSTTLQLARHGCDEGLALRFEQVLQRVDADHPVEGRIRHPKRQHKLPILDWTPMTIESVRVQALQALLEASRVDGTVQHRHRIRQTQLEQRKRQFPAPHPWQRLLIIERSILWQGQVGLSGNCYHAYIPFSMYCEIFANRSQVIAGSSLLRLVEVPIISQELPYLLDRIGTPVRSVCFLRTDVMLVNNAHIKSRIC